jgi:S-adenosylmethionine/arginine decarboxylase-like enzyme
VPEGQVGREEQRVTAHHFVGEGGYSEGLRAAAGDAAGLLRVVTAQVDAAGLQVMAEQAVPFPGGGATLVWVLAESHLVLHLWPEEDHVTIDLHICDYRTENEARARRLRDALDHFCFAPGSSSWCELAVGGRQLVSA